MATTAKKTNPALWDKVKGNVTRGDKGGRPGQWSARKAQMAVAEYKKRGGGYAGKKTGDNHLVQWTGEDWGTKSGRKSTKTGERYLPRKAREKLSDAEYERTTRKKRADTAKGKQFSRQPKDVARKVAPTRATGTRKAAPARAASRQSTAPTRAAGTRKAAPARAAGRQNTAPTRAAGTRKAAPTRAAGRRGGRLADLTRAELMERARKRNIPGRSRMRKDELAQALAR
jgi:hypothetical protein